MKKIIALAVATAISAPAMADLTIGGKVAAGYSFDSKNAPATATAAADNDEGGFGIDTAEVTFSGSETLENGLTVSGSISAGGLNRAAGGVGSQNANLKVAGDWGNVNISEGRGGSGISGVAADAVNLSGEVLNYGAGDSNNEGVKLTLAPIGGVTLAVNAYEAATGIGNGDDSRNYGYIASTTVGPVSVGVDYYPEASDGRLRLNLGADLGAAMVKLGYEDRDGKGKEMALGLTVPMDAVSFGVAYGQSELESGAKRSGYTAGVTYTMSSNVSVNANVASYEDVTTAEDQTKGAVVMSLAF